MIQTLLSVYLLQVVISIQINKDTRMFEDESGRTVLFHGMNIVVKSPPYIPITTFFEPQMSVSKEDLENMKMWGFNIVRLGVMWESVEVEPGVYNYTYLDLMNELVTSMGQYGIYSIIDAHQDLLANRICGEGMPNFYAQDLNEDCSSTLLGKLFHLIGQCKSIKEYGIRFDEKGNPLIEDCLKHGFAFYYLTPESANAFGNLFKNINNLQDKFLAFWNVVSKKFASNKFAIGYDIINEPWIGDPYSEPKNWLPGHFDKKYLEPLYQRAHEIIRQNDKEKIIFFEPVQIPDTFALFNGLVFPSGFSDTPGGQEYKSKVILNDHTYCCQVSAKACENGEPSLDMKDKCKSFHQRRLKQRVEDSQKYGTGLIISEFGACFESESCVEEISSVTEACDEHIVSWAYWQFKGFGDFTTTANTKEGLYLSDGTLQKNKLKALLRTYGQAYQGVPTLSNFNRTDGTYKTKFLLDLSVKDPTEIYFNKEYFYPNGVNVAVKTSVDSLYDVQVGEDNRVRILFTYQKISNEDNYVEAILSPK